MIKIGITGSIASGKSLAAKIISGKKYPLFDADQAVRKIYKNKNIKKKIAKHLKIANNSKLKKNIKELIKVNKVMLKKLERIIHPVVRKNMKEFMKKNKKKKILVFEIPLLIESKLMSNFDIILLISSNKKLRLQRYLKKGGKKEIFIALSLNQIPQARKNKFCDYKITNNKSIDILKKDVKVFINKYV